MSEFLLEILSEDIPARMQVDAAEELKRLVTEQLAAAGLTFATATAHSTPRRLALVIDGLPQHSPDRTEERKGPKVGAADGAIQGFLKSAGLASIDEAEIRETDKGAAYFAVRRIAGEPTERVLGAAIVTAADRLPWPKSMRWGTGRRRWVRPMKSILALFDGRIVPLPTDGPTDLPTPGATTVGHRFLGPADLTVGAFRDYEEKLLQHHVVLDREKRKWRILGDLKRLSESSGLRLVSDDPLLEEVAGLAEWPTILIGRIDEIFMDLPPEVRRTTMRANQKYFTLEYPDGRPAPRFALVSNMVTPDDGAAIVAGNERVLRARLSDARFFYDQDRRTKLAEQRPKLAKIAFHAKLGTLLERVERLERLTAMLAHKVGGDDTALLALEAARLCKCDLVTGMVGEFPELQGTMGRYYALDQGMPEAVGDAIRDHYRPIGPSDACPTAPVSVTLALAEKIDTLVGFFAIGEIPTGSKDPFALRRAALGLIRLIVENQLRIPLRQLFIDAPRAAAAANGSAEVIADQLLAFLADRLKVALRERGVRHDLIDAVFALGGEDDLVRLLSRVEALQQLLGGEDGANLLTAYRRAANILRIEEKRDGSSYDQAPDPDGFACDEERDLANALAAADAAVGPAIANEDFTTAMSIFAELRPVVDAFFDRVTVNVERPELRINRLRLLSRIRSTLNKIADFSRIG